MPTLANSEDPDVMLHNVAFHQGLHYLLRQRRSSEKEIYYNFYLEIISCGPSMYTMDQLKFTTGISNQKDEKVEYISA